MSDHSCMHCTPATATSPAEEIVHAPVELPAEPRRFRVHYPDGRRPQDCTLHPDGAMTTVMAGQVWRSALSFDAMRRMNWENAHIEWDPPPLEPELEPAESEPVAEQLDLGP